MDLARLLNRAQRIVDQAHEKNNYGAGSKPLVFVCSTLPEKPISSTGIRPIYLTVRICAPSGLSSAQAVTPGDRLSRERVRSHLQ